MSDLTKEEKVAQFYYNLSKFNTAMEAYQNHLRGANLYRNRHKIAEKNEMGKIKEEQAKEISSLDDAILRSDSLANEQLNLACDAFDELKRLLS